MILFSSLMDTIGVRPEKPRVGSRIFKPEGERNPIAFRRTEDGARWFTKIYFHPDRKCWYASTGSLVRGLMVFLTSPIEDEDDYLEIRGHGKNCVFADVLYDE